MNATYLRGVARDGFGSPIRLQARDTGFSALLPLDVSIPLRRTSHERACADPIPQSSNDTDP
jgi:hypothetical protein